MGTTGIVILSGLLTFILVKISIEIYKYFKLQPKVESGEPHVEEVIEPFIKISPEIEIDAENIKTQNHLRAMKYKLKMFKIRNEFYE